MGVYLGLVEDADYDGEADYDGGSAERAPARRPDHVQRAEVATTGGYDEPTEYGYAAADGSTGYAERPDGAPVAGYQITTLHPRTYNEARTIGEHFRDGHPVIMNLTEMDEPDAKRLVDFAAGLAFGLRGTIERVTNRVFLLSPANVQVTAEDKAKIAEGGFFNQS
jgi:cell division inhibitor SepF